ncbi:MAG: hypothetical protein ABI873_13505 [Marmoricola sp.]
MCTAALPALPRGLWSRSSFRQPSHRRSRASPVEAQCRRGPTKEAIARAAGGVLFIDEAYYLFRPENERDYGQEVIEILLTEMEVDRGNLVVVFAGYPDKMTTFFAANPGLSSRVPHHIAFEDYTHPELAHIAELMVAAESFRFDDNAREAFSEYLHRRMKRPQFSNARSVRNAVERTRLRQARRLVELKRPLSRDDLVTLRAEDVYGSSVLASTTVHQIGAEVPEP